MNNQNGTVSEPDDDLARLYPMSQIENVWMECRGDFHGFSPLEWSYLEAWLLGGISSTAIIEGIRESFRTFKAKRRGDQIRSLAYCQQAIYRHAEELSIPEYWQRRAKELQREAAAAIARHKEAHARTEV